MQDKCATSHTSKESAHTKNADKQNNAKLCSLQTRHGATRRECTLLLVDDIHTQGVALDREESAHAPCIVRSITRANLRTKRETHKLPFNCKKN